MSWLSRVMDSIQGCWVLFKRRRQGINPKHIDLPDMCPLEEVDGLSEYHGRLDYLLFERSEAVRGIGVTAPYAGGKSTFLKNYFTLRPSLKHSYISLASFIEDAKGNTPERAGDTDGSEIEHAILKQLIYSRPRGASSGSGYMRTFELDVSHRLAWLLSTYLVLWGAAFGILYNQGGAPSLVDVTSSIGASGWWQWPIMALTALPAVLWAVKSVICKARRFRLSGINPVSGSVSFDKHDGDNQSIFNRHIEDVIHHFIVTGTEVVVLEDLDRLNNLNIFVKLRELNKLINDCVRVRQNVRFIYAVGDDLFTGSNRTKFFDSIIPIVPVINRSNVVSHFKVELGKAGFSNIISEAYLKSVAVYINDMRVLKSIVTEFGIYRAVLGEEVPEFEDQKLLSMCIYKSLYAKDFSKIHTDESTLNQLLELAEKHKSLMISDLKGQLTSLESKIDDSESECIKTQQELRTLMFVRISELLSPDMNVADILGRSLKQCSENESSLEIIMSHSGSLTGRCFRGYSLSNNKTGLQASAELCSDYESRRSAVDIQGQVERRKLESRIRSIQNEVDRVGHLTLREVCASESFHNLASDNSELRICSNPLNVSVRQFLLYMLKKGHIDPKYHLYISRFSGDEISHSDYEYVMSVRTNNPLAIEHGLTETRNLQGYFDLSDAEQRAYLNVDMIEYLLKNNKNHHLQAVFEGIRHREDEAEILLDITNGLAKESVDCWFNVLVATGSALLIDIVNQTSTSDQSRLKILLLTLIFSDSKKIKTHLGDAHEDFVGIISRATSTLPLLHSLLAEYPSVGESEVALNLHQNNVQLARIVGCDGAGVLIEACIEQCVILYSLESLIGILACFGHSLEPGDISFERLQSFSELAPIFERHFEDVVSLVASGELVATADSVETILVDHALSDELVLNLIASQELYTSDLTLFNSSVELVSSALLHGRLRPTLANITEIMEINDFDCKYVNDYLNDADIQSDLKKDALIENRATSDRSRLLTLLVNSGLEADLVSNLINEGEWKISVENLSEDLAIEVYQALVFGDALDLSPETLTFFCEQDRDLAIDFYVRNSEKIKVGGEIDTNFDLGADYLQAIIESDQISVVTKSQIISAYEEAVGDMHSNSALRAIAQTTIQAYQEQITTPQLSLNTVLNAIEYLGWNDAVKLCESQVEFYSSAKIGQLLESLGGEFEGFMNQSQKTFSYSDPLYEFFERISRSNYLKEVRIINDGDGKPDRLLVKKKLREEFA